MWMKKLFGVKKPIIALLHLRALPGDPLYGKDGNLEDVVNTARQELRDLQNGGVDGILIANEFSFPYENNVSHVTTATMARIIGELMSEISLPFGTNVVLNQIESIELAAATGAQFTRSAFTGAYIGENGIINTNVASSIRRKKELGLDNLKLFFKVNPESDVYLAQRDIQMITKSIIARCFPDGLCVSGARAGIETNTNIIKDVKEVATKVPVFCNTGCNKENIKEKLSYSDGAFVGTTFKKDGKFDKLVDIDRVIEFMDVVKDYRKEI